jgi:hypothetical protein
MNGSDDLGAEGEAAIVLRPRNQPFPGQFRTVRRLALLTLLLQACRGEQASLPQLHVLNWAVRTPESRRAFLAVVRGEVPPDEAVVRFDPTLPRAIQFAVGEQIVQDRVTVQETLHVRAEARVSEYRIKLTDKGRAIAAAVEDTDILVDERIFLETLNKKLTQAMIDDILKWGHQ